MAVDRSTSIVVQMDVYVLLARTDVINLRCGRHAVSMVNGAPRATDISDQATILFFSPSVSGISTGCRTNIIAVIVRNK